MESKFCNGSEDGDKVPWTGEGFPEEVGFELDLNG